MGLGDCRGGASLDTTLHHPVLAVSPAGAGLVALEDQRGLDLVKFLEQPPILGEGGADSGFHVVPPQVPRIPR